MPSTFQYKPYPFQGSSLNINYTQGWQSRTIYQYFGSPGTYMYDYMTNGTPYTRNLFEGIENHTFTENLQSYTYRGTYKFRPIFFTTGKRILIKGRVNITSTSTGIPIFNIQVGTVSPIAGGQRIGATNGGNDHYVGNDLNVVPVDFEVILTSFSSYQLNTSNNDEYEGLFFKAEGAMQYSSDNIHGSYVPITTISADHPSADLLDPADSEIKLVVDFNDSAGVDRIEVVHLSMVEYE